MSWRIQQIRLGLYFLRYCGSHVMIESQCVLVLSGFHFFGNAVVFEECDLYRELATFLLMRRQVSVCVYILYLLVADPAVGIHNHEFLSVLH